MRTPTRLPSDETSLRLFLTDELGFGPDDGLPFWGLNGEWVALEAIEWTRYARQCGREFSEWNEDDPDWLGGEGSLKDFAKGKIPVSLLGPPGSVDVRWKNASGNAMFLVPGARTREGTAPVFLHDHDDPDHARVRARSVAELFARFAADVWGDRWDQKDAAWKLAWSSVELDPAWLVEAARTRGMTPDWLDSLSGGRSELA